MQIEHLDVCRAISDVAQRKQHDMLQFLYMIDQYGLSEIATWLHNVEADMSGCRVPRHGTISEPNRG